MPTVVGIDTSLTSTGLALLRDTGIPVLARVRSAGKKDDTLAMRFQRLDKLGASIIAFVQEAKPDLVVIEGPSMASQHGHPHDRSGLWWLVAFSLHKLGLPTMEVPPNNRIKYATGKGAGPLASKDAVLTAVVRRYSDIEVANNDEADAVLLAAIGMRMLGAPLEPSLPQANLDALTKLKLP